MIKLTATIYKNNTMVIFLSANLFLSISGRNERCTAYNQTNIADGTKKKGRLLTKFFIKTM